MLQAASDQIGKSYRRISEACFCLATVALASAQGLEDLMLLSTTADLWSAGGWLGVNKPDLQELSVPIINATAPLQKWSR